VEGGRGSGRTKDQGPTPTNNQRANNQQSQKRKPKNGKKMIAEYKFPNPRDGAPQRNPPHWETGAGLSLYY
jgi:hypothetical protein